MSKHKPTTPAIMCHARSTNKWLHRTRLEEEKACNHHFRHFWWASVPRSSVTHTRGARSLPDSFPFSAGLSDAAEQTRRHTVWSLSKSQSNRTSTLLEKTGELWKESKQCSVTVDKWLTSHEAAARLYAALTPVRIFLVSFAAMYQRFQRTCPHLDGKYWLI